MKVYKSRARQLVGAVSGSVLLAALGTPALAQTAGSTTESTAEPQEELVVVTGIRASLRNSVSVKRNLDVVAEVVSAEDIGKLPDVSIAESLARLPGLTAQRVDGRAQRLSVRGLGPDFTTAMLNGREQVSTNDNRGVEFDQYPSELLGSVNVYKTAQAGLLAQGIAGTVDLRTVRPLSRNERIVVVNGKVEWNSLGALNPDSDEYGYRFSGAYIDQFMDGRLGVAFGFAVLDTDYQNQKTERYSLNNTAYDWAPGPAPAVVGGDIRGPEGLKVMSQSNSVERVGILGVLEFEPTESFSVVVDAYYSEFNEGQRQRGFETNISRWNGSAIANAGAVLDGRDLVAGTVTNGALALRSIENTRDATLTAIGARAEWRPSDNWTLGLDVSYSSAERTDEQLETNVQLVDAAGQPIRYSYQFDGRGENLRLTAPAGFTDANRLRLGSPYGWGNGYLKIPGTEDELTSIRLDARRELSGERAVRSIEFGVNFSQREKTRQMRGGSEFNLNIGNNNGRIPAAAVIGVTDLSHGGAGQTLVYSAQGLLASGGLVRSPNSGPWFEAKNWNVTEDVWTAFIKFDFETEFAGVPTTGNFGAQYIHTEQTSSGRVAGFGASFPASATESYGEFLPSANVNFELSENMYLRIGLSRVLNRVQMTDLRISREFSYDPSRALVTDLDRSPWSSEGGNPFLRPWLSRNFDISFENYFGRNGAYWAVALFQKNLESYIQPGGTRVLIDFSGVVVPPTQPQPVLRQGFARAPANGEGGIVKGIEFSLNLPFETFSEALDGFGLTFNYGRNYSDIVFNVSAFGRTDVAGSTDLPGFSKETANLSVYFERAGWQARVSGRYRSSALQELIGFGADFEYKVNKAETIIDAQVGYTFQDGPLEGLAITANASNLTNEPWITGTQNPFRWMDSNTYGTTYSVGVSYRF